MSSSSEPTPRRAMKKLHCYFFTDDELHAEYAWAWVLHNLVPFTDKVLGIAGAMDQRPIGALDWQIRLPLSLAVAANPTSKPLLAAGHAANVAFWFARMPAVWKSHLHADFNVRVIERFGPDSSAVLRELDASNRSVQKSAESTSI
jgi:hypothetical protein